MEKKKKKIKKNNIKTTLSGKKMSDLFFRRTIFSSPPKKFRIRRIRRLFATHYVYKCISTKYLGKKLICKNISSDKIFVTFIPHFLSDKTTLMIQLEGIYTYVTSTKGNIFCLECLQFLFVLLSFVER